MFILDTDHLTVIQLPLSKPDCSKYQLATSTQQLSMSKSKCGAGWPLLAEQTEFAKTFLRTGSCMLCSLSS